MAYDSQNIFAKILRGEIPCTKVFEDDYALAFRDIHPQAPVHVLVIPKGEYENQTHFYATASAEEMIGFNKALVSVVKEAGLDESGYRAISNCGVHGGQEVPHFHVHLLGGGLVGRMVCR